MTRTIVIGAGLGGLVTAHALSAQGHDVLVLEASGRIGGQVRTVVWHGRPVDVGAEAMFLGAPPLTQLLCDIGLSASLVAPVRGSSWLRRGNQLVQLPEGVGPTGPTKLKPVVTSGLLSPVALARAGFEPLLAHKRIEGDISVGEFVSARFGRAVADTFVDPLLGNLHAGDIDRLSLISTAPQLVPAAREGRSLVRGSRHAPPRPTPAGAPATSPFASFASGLETLTQTLSQGVAIHTVTPALAVRRLAHGWEVDTDSITVSADRLVIATPAAVAATLLEPIVPGIGADLRADRTADVATVLFAYPRGAADNPALRDGNGLLLRSGSGRLLKAATFLSRKWAHLSGSDVYFVRASAGRAGVDALSLLDDRTLAKRLHNELADIIGLDTRPLDSLVTRWPGAYPQLEVGHAARLQRIRARLAAHPVQLVGAPYDGLGIPSVVKSALAATQA